MKSRQQLMTFIEKQKTAFIASVDEEGRFRYEGVMLVGTMEVLQDAEIKQELWHPGDTMYYSGGVTDPDYCVLKFTAVKGRHYCALKKSSFAMADLV